MQKRWVIKDVDEVTADKLASELNVEKTIARLLVQRGISTYEEAKSFFRPEMSMLHDPFLMKDMDRAVERIINAAKNNESILIYGDYDVDGTTSVALVFTFFKQFFKRIDYYIPDRYKEGYGISTQGIDFAHQNGFSLIIALDCGIKSNDKISYANSLGVDFIICDHHLPGESIPEAVAVLDPKRVDCEYPYKELSGCGVGFKLIQAYSIATGQDTKSLEEYLDLVVVSIASDIVPITGENRVLAYYGLKKLNADPRPGLKTILELANVKREKTITDIVFVIGPRINAAGRIKSGKSAVELLVSEHTQHALDPGKLLNEHNTERKSLDALITKEALAMIDNDLELVQRKSTVVFSSEWHKGVVGIVASRLTEKYYRPTIVLTESNGVVTGSARSVKDFDVYKAIEACSDLLEQFGGHKYAAGLTLRKENLQAFSGRFEEVVAGSIEEHMLTPEIEIDAEIELSEVTPRLYRILKQFAPFGPGNMAPVFLAKTLRDKGYAKIVGSSHLKVEICEHNPIFSIGAIGFGLGNKLPVISSGNRFDACFSVEENEYMGKMSLQLNLKDLKASKV